MNRRTCPRMAPLPERKSPKRTCVACGRTGDKRSFLRIAGRPGGDWRIDPQMREPGRGIYLCEAEECVRRFSRRLQARRGGDRWKMGRKAGELAAQVEIWWSSRGV